MWVVFLQKDKPLNARDTAEADCIRLRIKKNGLLILYDPDCE